MTEETPKKPRRKRRTKAQIEADKAAELAAKQAEEECAPCQESAMAALEAAEAAIEEEEPPVVRPTSSVYDNQEKTPATYANPNMERIANRFKRNRANRKANLG